MFKMYEKIVQSMFLFIYVFLFICVLMFFSIYVIFLVVKELEKFRIC